MRDDAFAVLRRVGVETGGSNVQFAVDPATGERLVIEMNPRVSRSSALASKATGFPIAKIAARLAVGYTLDEIRNDITEVTPASFEPVIDYVVTKIPRWAFEKLPGATAELGTRMQSVGEVMAIGRNFAESLQKAVRSLEQGRAGFALGRHSEFVDFDLERLWHSSVVATPERLFALHELLWRGATIDDVVARTGIDCWFIHQLSEIIERERELVPEVALETFDARAWRRYKQWGFSDPQIADLCGRGVEEVTALRRAAGVVTTFKTVDTCAAEFEASTPYHYSTYEDTSEVLPSSRDRVIILGSGPNRIG
jgi:carbamoyl-phosphate synthase large subunit